MTAQVSLVITVLNEAESIPALLHSLAAQTQPPTEIIIVDGGSTDDTVTILRRWQGQLPLTIIEHPGATIAVGRNAGITAAQGPIIAITDAGVRFAANWLANLIAPFAATPAPTVVAGFFVPDPQTTFERAMGATVLPTLAEIDSVTFLPSSRSIAFQRTAWEQAGGYPTWLDYCEDLIFDLRLRQQGGHSAFAPTAVVQFRPRGDLRSFWHQYFRYARGDGKAGLFARRHALRYATYLALPASLRLGRRYPLLWLLLGLAGCGYLRRPYQRLLPWLRPLSPQQRAWALALVPLIRCWGDLAKMAGYPVGLLWRWRRYGLRHDWRTITDNAADHD